MFGLGMQFEHHMSEWLYGEWSEEKLLQYEMLHQVPILGSYMDYLLDVRNDKQYMDRYGISYSDITDPRKLKQTSSGSALYGSAFSFVSKNLDRLYQ